MKENIKLPLDIKLMNGLSAGMIVLIIILTLIYLAKNLKSDIADMRGIVITGEKCFCKKSLPQSNQCEFNRALSVRSVGRFR